MQKKLSLLEIIEAPTENITIEKEDLFLCKADYQRMCMLYRVAKNSVPHYEDALKAYTLKSEKGTYNAFGPVARLYAKISKKYPEAKKISDIFKTWQNLLVNMLVDDINSSKCATGKLAENVKLGIDGAFEQFYQLYGEIIVNNSEMKTFEQLVEKMKTLG